MDSTLSGSRATAMPSLKPQPLNVLENFFGGKFQATAGKAAIESRLSKMGPGTRAVVYGGRGKNQVGHVFNAVVGEDGLVRFFDGQTGKMASFSGFKSFHLLITGP